MAERWAPGELVIELAGPKNQQFTFRPLAATLRGRWETRNVPNPSSVNTGMAALPDIPGLYVCLDGKAKVLRAVDPLGFRENRELMDRANAVRSTWFGEGRPWDEIKKKNLTQTEIKTALWNMAEMIWSGNARIINGAIPDKRKILEMPGDLQVRWHFTREGETPYASPEELVRLSDGELTLEAASQ